MSCGLVVSTIFFIYQHVVRVINYNWRLMQCCLFVCFSKQSEVYLLFASLMACLQICTSYSCNKSNLRSLMAQFVQNPPIRIPQVWFIWKITLFCLARKDISTWELVLNFLYGIRRLASGMSRKYWHCQWSNKTLCRPETSLF